MPGELIDAGWWDSSCSWMILLESAMAACLADVVAADEVAPVTLVGSWAIMRDCADAPICRWLSASTRWSMLWYADGEGDGW